MTSEIIKCAADIMRVSVEEASKNSKPVPEIDGWYFWNPARGGFSVLISSNGEKLAASSSITFEKHLQAFKEGKRN